MFPQRESFPKLLLRLINIVFSFQVVNLSRPLKTSQKTSPIQHEGEVSEEACEEDEERTIEKMKKLS